MDERDMEIAQMRGKIHEMAREITEDRKALVELNKEIQDLYEMGLIRQRTRDRLIRLTERPRKEVRRIAAMEIRQTRAEQCREKGAG